MSQAALPRSHVRVLVVDDHHLFADSIALALSIEGYDVRRTDQDDQSSAARILQVVRATMPAIVLLDLDLGPFIDGLTLITPIRQAGARVIVVTASSDRAIWGACLGEGARIVLAKTSALTTILATVRNVHAGRPVISLEERNELIRCAHTHRRQTDELARRLDDLTRRELEVLGQLTQGRSVREIAQASYTSEATVRTQVKSILAKLDVSSQLAAVAIAHRAGRHILGPTEGSGN
jgi:two-component system nitrate/nitrite response regulator NarL